MVNNIVFVNSTMSLGGGVKVLFTWANELASKGYNVEMVSNTHDPIIYEHHTAIEISYLSLSKNIKWNSLTAIKKLLLLVWKKRNSVFVFSKGQYIIPLYLLKSL